MSPKEEKESCRFDLVAFFVGVFLHMTHTTPQEVAPILRIIFPELPDSQLQEMHDGFVVLFGMLHEERMREKETKAPRCGAPQ
jgi:uncharacterized heparinase superfamily protein